MPSELSSLKPQNHKISVSLFWMGGDIINSIHSQILLTEYVVQRAAFSTSLHYFCQIINRSFHSSPWDAGKTIHYLSLPREPVPASSSHGHCGHTGQPPCLFRCLDEGFPSGPDPVSPSQPSAHPSSSGQLPSPPSPSSPLPVVAGDAWIIANWKVDRQEHFKVKRLTNDKYCLALKGIRWNKIIVKMG